MHKLRNYQTKRALRKQIERLKEDVKYRNKIIDDLETDLAIAKSLVRNYRRENSKLTDKINELVGSEGGA